MVGKPWKEGNLAEVYILKNVGLDHIPILLPLAQSRPVKPLLRGIDEKEYLRIDVCERFSV